MNALSPAIMHQGLNFNNFLFTKDIYKMIVIFIFGIHIHCLQNHMD